MERVVIHPLVWAGSEYFVPVLYRRIRDGVAWEPVGIALGLPYSTRAQAERRAERGWPGIPVEHAHGEGLL